MKYWLRVSMQTQDVDSALMKVSTLAAFQSSPTQIAVDSVSVPVEVNWQQQLITQNQKAKIDAYSFWEPYRIQIGMDPRSELFSFAAPDIIENLTQTIGLLTLLPFSCMTMATYFREAWLAADYPTWGFGRSHLSHGWGCAFRGAGHDRLVSRRWLDFGPWRVIRRPNDTTFIQFHDLAITDPAAAYTQAAPGHERIGIAATGGYIAWHNEKLLIGARRISRIYLPETNKIEIVVGPGNTVSQGEMICQCAERLQHRLAPPPTDRIDHIAYIFMERADAEAHLHELWLRELECWYVDGRGKHRLDLDYHPVPNPPAWVRALDDK